MATGSTRRSCSPRFADPENDPSGTIAIQVRSLVRWLLRLKGIVGENQR